MTRRANAYNILRVWRARAALASALSAQTLSLNAHRSNSDSRHNAGGKRRHRSGGVSAQAARSGAGKSSEKA